MMGDVLAIDQFNTGEDTMGFAMNALDTLVLLFVFAVGCIAFVALVLFVLKMQFGAIILCWAVSDICFRLWVNFSASISLRWIAKNCRLTVRNANGSSARARGAVTRWPSVQRVI